jgi:hypothetical protein
MCRKKHPEREFPLNSKEECAICELNHAKSSCPSLLGLKVVFQGTGKYMEKLYLMGSRKSMATSTTNGKSRYVLKSILVFQ